MKTSSLILSILFISCVIVLSSCTKKTVQPKASATIIFNSSTTVEADSVHWDYYSAGVPRMQAFKDGIAIITLWPGTIATGTRALSSQYLYWIIQSPTVYTVNSSGGTLTITNTANVLDGTFSATGDVWTGTGPSPTTVSATFAHVRQLGM